MPCIEHFLISAAHEHFSSPLHQMSRLSDKNTSIAVSERWEQHDFHGALKEKTLEITAADQFVGMEQRLHHCIFLI